MEAHDVDARRRDEDRELLDELVAAPREVLLDAAKHAYDDAREQRLHIGPRGRRQRDERRALLVGRRHREHSDGFGFCMMSTSVVVEDVELETAIVELSAPIPNQRGPRGELDVFFRSAVPPAVFLSLVTDALDFGFSQPTTCLEAEGSFLSKASHTSFGDEPLDIDIPIVARNAITTDEQQLDVSVRFVLAQ